MTTLEQAQQDVNTLSKKPSNENLLFLYAHYKQATTGDCLGKRPIVKETKIRYDLLFMAYSLDYRQLILSKLESGASYRALARDYNLSKTTIQKWKKDINRKLRISKPLKIDNDKLREDVAMYPDDYQHERALRFNCSQRAIGIALKRIGITQKKDINSPPS